MQNKKLKPAIVMIGRMNPPTAGHYYVIDKMKEYAREKKLSAEFIVVVIEGKETSKDKTKNPLTSDQRIKFMQASGKANGVKFMVSDNAMNAFTAVRDAGYEPAIIAAGSDRAKNYLEMLDKYFPIEKDGVVVKHRAVPGLERDTQETASEDMTLDVKKISGSMARHAVAHGFLDEFIEIVGLKEKPNLGKLLFDKVKQSMESEKQNESI